MNGEIMIIRLEGGLGNQMFQWAYAKSPENRFKVTTMFDMSYFKHSFARPFELDVFGIKPEEITDPSDKFKINLIRFFRKNLHEKNLLGINYYNEPHFEFDKKLLMLPGDTYVTGFFQSERYFKNIQFILQKEFEFKDELDEQNKEIANMINSCNSVSLHVRRGDYVQKKHFQKMYAKCSPEYYKKAVEMIVYNPVDTKLFVFSDDIPWCKENLQLPYEVVYVENNTGKDSYKDMQLMSMCKHNVISNSTFSWWGAWLNKNPGKMVIAPRKWFNNPRINQSDVIPKTWITIDN